jgi:hypothetical protein
VGGDRCLLTTVFADWLDSPLLIGVLKCNPRQWSKRVATGQQEIVNRKTKGMRLWSAQWVVTCVCCTEKNDMLSHA